MKDLDNNQENQEKWGGARPNSGRPKGSGHKPKITDDLTEKEKQELLKKTLEKAMKGDSKLLQFLVEQIYGKAPQSIDMGGGVNLVLQIAKQVADKNEQDDTNTNTSESS
jgi:hypothetical protein